VVEERFGAGGGRRLHGENLVVDGRLDTHDASPGQPILYL
jgi:hypothetical protein